MSKYQNLSKEELITLLQKHEEELRRKKYGLVWEKEREPEKVVLECAKHLPVLKAVSERTLNTDASDDNILIEGDNYHALSVLCYTHKEKIDVIYIDPPYNTGNKDFIYNDRFVEKEDKYRHSKWLNFMEKRLLLARDLLKDTGVIFISIDDNEMYNLKLLSDRVFGEENFIANLPTIMNLKGNNDQFGFAGTHEYTIVYAKNILNVKLNEFEVDEEKLLLEWHEDDIGLYKKGANLKSTGGNAPREKRPNLFFPIFISYTTKSLYVTNDDKPISSLDTVLLPITDGKEMSWRWSKQKVKNEIYDIIISDNGLYKKQRPDIGDLPSKKPKSLFYKPEYSSGNGTSQLKNMFSEKVFNNPKPPELIKDILYLSSKKDSIILDFFAGSGTTGHAVLELNKQDGGNRKFILCTNNENGICENVTYPRLQKVIEGYQKNGNGERVEGLGGNLRYFKTALLPKSKSPKQLKAQLTRECLEMLCVKENIFNLYSQTKSYKLFTCNANTRYLCVYFNTSKSDFKEFLGALKSLDGEKRVYVFSDKESVDGLLFKGIKNCYIEEIPQKILDVYKRLVKLNVPSDPETIFIDFEKARKRVFDEKDKEDGARLLRVVLEKVIEKIAAQSGVNVNDFGELSRLNDHLKQKEMISKIIWEENKTYIAIGNSAAHGDYDEYEIKDVEHFYRHIQSLIEKHIG